MPKFDWDPNKDALNQRKHKMRFEDAIRIFANENELVTEFNGVVNGEERWEAVGILANAVIIVIHTIENENGSEELYRVISARKLKPHERKKYGYR